MMFFETRFGSAHPVEKFVIAQMPKILWRRTHWTVLTQVTEKGYNVLEYLAKMGDDKLEDDDADDESESEDENTPPVKKAKISNDDLEPIVLLERINLSFDETGNVFTDFKGFS
uniref:Protein sip5 n=1 Tax=Lygus hesperus TaxID=30085 RepID=A0A0A9X0U5_LYGHE